MTLYGYARVSVREPEDKNLDLQVERLVLAGCAMGNIRENPAIPHPQPSVPTAKSLPFLEAGKTRDNITLSRVYRIPS